MRRITITLSLCGTPAELLKVLKTVAKLKAK